MAEKWPRFGGPRQRGQTGACVNWVDWLRTSSDKRVWSGRRAVVMGCWLLLFCAYPSFLVDGRLGCWPRRVSPSGLQRTGRRAQHLGANLGFLRSMRSYVHFVCVCVYMCLCVCVRTWYMYKYACVYAFVYLCVYTHVYVYVYAYLCIDCGSWYQCFSEWTVSCMRVFLCAYACVYVCV